MAFEASDGGSNPSGSTYKIKILFMRILILFSLSEGFEGYREKQTALLFENPWLRQRSEGCAEQCEAPESFGGGGIPTRRRQASGSTIYSRGFLKVGNFSGDL